MSLSRVNVSLIFSSSIPSIDLLKLGILAKNGKNISVTEADSLTYTAALLKYNSNDCVNAINRFTNYLNQFPTGSYALEANFFISECFLNNKDWTNALVGYTYVNNKGYSRYFEKATAEAAQINYFELKNYKLISP